MSTLPVFEVEGVDIDLHASINSSNGTLKLLGDFHRSCSFDFHCFTVRVELLHAWQRVKEGLDEIGIIFRNYQGFEQLRMRLEGEYLFLRVTFLDLFNESRNSFVLDGVRYQFIHGIVLAEDFDNLVNYLVENTP